MELLQLLEFFFPQNVTRVELPSSAAIPFLIGKKGLTIKALQQNYEIVIEVLRQNSLVYLNGIDTEKLSLAKVEVEKLMTEWSGRNVEVKGTLIRSY